MSGVKIRSAEFGLRPIDSIAAAVARPWPSAAPNAAMPSPSPAASAIRPLYHPPPPSAAVSANAGLATRMAPSAATSGLPKRCMCFPSRAAVHPFLSSCHPPLPPGRRPHLQTLVIVAHGERDVDRAEHREYERLDDGHERPQDVEDDRDPELGQLGEDLDHLVIGEHVRKESDAERDRPEEVAEGLDHEHERRQEEHRAEELLHVLRAVLAGPVEVIRKEGDDPEAERDVEVGGRGREAGYESDQVRDQDEDEEGREERHVALGAVPD